MDLDRDLDLDPFSAAGLNSLTATNGLNGVIEIEYFE